MQKCGQLHASMAVALIAQSAEGAVWPADTPRRAITDRKAILRIGVPLLSGRIIYPNVYFRKGNPTRRRPDWRARSWGLQPLGDLAAEAISIHSQRLHRLNRGGAQCRQQCSH